MAKGDSYAASQLFMGLTPKNGFKAAKLYCYKPINGSGDFTWSRNLAAYRKNQSGVLELMGVNVPRIDYTNTCPELLIEPERENLVLRSQEFDNASWTKYNLNITPDSINSPSNALTADSLVDTAVNNIHGLEQSFSAINGEEYVISVYAKKGNRNFIFINFANANGVFVSSQAYFNLNTGTLGTVNAGITASIEDVGNGWYRCIAKRTALATATGTIGLFVANSDNSLTYLGNGTTALYLWGAQVEQGFFVTSYIPTTNASVTRPQDTNSSTIAFTGDGFSYNLRVRLENRGDVTTPDNIFFISDNSGLSDVYVGCYVLGDNLVFTFYNNPDVQEFSISLADGIHNIGVALDTVSGDYDIVIDGASEFSGTLPDSFTSLGNYTRVKLGCLNGSTDSIGLNRIIGVQVYDAVLPQGELIEYTTA